MFLRKYTICEQTVNKVNDRVNKILSYISALQSDYHGINHTSWRQKNYIQNV